MSEETKVKSISAHQFKKKMVLQGIYLDSQKKLNMGFTFENHTFKQKTSFKTFDQKQIIFEPEGVIHLNEKITNLPCPFCYNVATHLSPCNSLSNSELQNIVIEVSMQNLEQNA